MTVKLMETTIPLKPAKSGFEANEFFHLEAFKGLEGKFYVEPKYDGIRVQAHRSGDELKVFTEEGSEIQQRLPKIVAELKGFDYQEFILDGELVKYEGRKLLPHEAVVSLIHEGEGEVDERGLRFIFFDILWLGGKATVDLPLKERKDILDRFPDTEHIQQVKYVEADGGEEVIKAIWEVGSNEGAVVKDIESQYTKEHAKRWYKFKNQKEIDAEIIEIEETPKGAFIYTCAILDREGNRVQIGKTFATSLEAKEGDIIRVAVDRVMVKDSQPSWLIPKVIEIRHEKEEPDSIAVVEQLAKHSSLWDEVLMATQMRGEFVLQRHWWGEASHHDLRLTKRHGWFGFTIPEGDTVELKHRLNEGGKLLAFKKAYYGDMEWMEYGKDEVKVIPEGADYHGMKGNPSKKYKAYMKAVDWGEYTLEQRTETEFLLRFEGEEDILDGRCYIILAPEDMQEKDKPEKWLFFKAKEQEEKEIQSILIPNETAIIDVPRHIVEVTIIKPGPAKVKVGGAQVIYTEEALRKSLPLWEGAACFCDHFNKSVRNIAGVYFSPWYDDGVKAKLRFIDDTAYQIVQHIIADQEKNLPVPDIGISADIAIRGMPVDHWVEVQEITQVISADIVFSPAAGGSFDRVLNSLRHELGIPEGQNQPFHSGSGTPEKPDTQNEKELVPVKRVRDLQSTADKLRAQVQNQEAELTELQSNLEQAVAKYREGIIATYPEIPPQLIHGSTIEEVDASLERAQAVVETVKQHLEEKVPAGAPPRRGPNVESMSPRQKIEHALRRS